MSWKGFILLLIRQFSLLIIEKVLWLCFYSCSCAVQCFFFVIFNLCWATVSAHTDSSHRSNIGGSYLPAILYYPSFSYSLSLSLPLSVSPSWINIHSVLAWNGHTAPGTRRSDAAIIIPLQWSHTSIFHQSCGSLPWLLFGWLKQMMWQWGGPAYHSSPC